MKINKTQDFDILTISLEGRLDTNTAPELEKELEASLTDAIKNLILNFKGLEYISSAGLRVILAAQKKMNAVSGTMTVKEPNDTVREVFEVTGFLDMLTIE